MPNGWGGKRPGAGRKPKKKNKDLIEKMSPYDDDILEVLAEKALDGESWAVRLWMEYRYGKAIQQTETIITADTVKEMSDEELDRIIDRITAVNG